MSDSIKDLNTPSPWNMRIWDEAKHQWLCDGEDDVLPYYGFDIRGGEVTAMQSMDWVYRQFEHGRKLIWERSTGLTDKNGKEIYEGDILFNERLGEYYEVFWDTEDCQGWGIFWPEAEGGGGYFPLAKIRGELCSVVGNIHEKDKLVDSDHVKGGEDGN